MPRYTEIIDRTARYDAIAALTPSPDLAVLADIRATYRTALAQARHTAGELAREMQHVDADAVMAALDAQFGRGGAVEDCFADAFHDAEKAARAVGGEYLSNRAAP